MNIRPAVATDLPGLAAILVAAVADGASIGFMAGLDATAAHAFWDDRLTAQALGQSLVLVADLAGSNAGGIAGTITLALATPANQPHRADVQKMMVAPVARRQGLGAALLIALEHQARAHTRSLLVLDTISHSAAARLYERHGWTRAGDIPDYALMPQGGLAPTTIYYKNLLLPPPP